MRRQKITPEQRHELVQIFLHMGETVAAMCSVEYGVSPLYAWREVQSRGWLPQKNYRGGGDIAFGVDHSDPRWARAVERGAVTGMSRHWTQEETILAREMLARGEGEAAFQAAFGKSKTAAKCRVEKRPLVRSYRRRGRPTGFSPVPPNAAAIADAQRRAALLPSSLTAALCNDPLPGYSALDRRASA